MKTKITSRSFAVLTVVLMLIMTALTAVNAADLDGDGYDDETGEYVGVVTEPYTEAPFTEVPYTEPATDAPYTEEPATDAPTSPIDTEPVTEAPQTQIVTEPQPQTEVPTQVQYVDDGADYTIDPQAPTMSKTVSKKSYSTNYTAGIISWICVGVGLIAVAVVLVSTKVSGNNKNTFGRR